MLGTYESTPFSLLQSVEPVTIKGRLLALASVEIDVDGITFALHGVQVV